MAERDTRRNREGKMPLGAHLLELRKRLFLAAIGIVLGGVVGWIFSGWIWEQLRHPVTAMAEALHRNAEINYPHITSAFELQLQVALYSGLILSSPIWLYQIFAFLTPGLTRTEKRYTFGFFFTAVPLFVLGCAAGWYVLPNIVKVMASFVPEDTVAWFDASTYFNFVMKLMLAIGVAFVLPVFIVLLNFAGILSAASIIKSWRIAILVICLFTAFATPAADVISMFLLAIPMVALYFAAYGITYLHDRRVAKRAAALEAEYADLG